MSLAITCLCWNKNLESWEEAGCKRNVATVWSASLRKLKIMRSACVNMRGVACEGTRWNQIQFQAISSFSHLSGVPQVFAVAL